MCAELFTIPLAMFCFIFVRVPPFAADLFVSVLKIASERVKKKNQLKVPKLHQNKDRNKHIHTLISAKYSS